MTRPRRLYGAYSPYDNLERKAYPAILVTTSLNDSQVMYWEPAKYCGQAEDAEDRRKPAFTGNGGAGGRSWQLFGATSWRQPSNVHELLSGGCR